MRGARGALLFEWRRLHEAHRDLIAVFEAGRHDSDTLMHLGWVDYGSANLSAAERWFDEATRVKPDRHDAHAYLGFVLMAQRRLDEADSCLRTRVVLAPS